MGLLVLQMVKVPSDTHLTSMYFLFIASGTSRETFATHAACIKWKFI
jgi:hypothetical protein